MAKKQKPTKQKPKARPEPDLAGWVKWMLDSLR